MALQCDRTPKEIAEFLQFPKSTVYDLTKSFKESKEPGNESLTLKKLGATKLPAGLHVLEVISSEGNVMPPHFFGKGQTVTKEIYLNVMKKVVKPWMVQTAAGKP